MALAVSFIHLKEAKDDNVDCKDVICTVLLEKRHNMDSANDFLICLKTMIEGGVEQVIVEMGQVGFIDSTGIGSLIFLAKLIRQKKGEIAVVGISEDISKILDLVNFRKFIQVFATKSEAIDFFKNRG